VLKKSNYLQGNIMAKQKDLVIIGSDHAGYEMKEFVKQYLESNDIPYFDAGALSLDPADDYPEFAFNVAKGVASGKYPTGIVMCGSGIGVSIAANRIKKVRAALCITPDMARMAKLHNDANVLVIGGRITPKDVAKEILDSWFKTDFEGGRHQKRVDQMDTGC
jgi:ribose 5-phosphate isomerase B